MKKLLSVLVAVLTITLPTVVFAAPNEAYSNVLTDNIQYITDNNNNFNKLKDFMENDGIVVVVHNNGAENYISEKQLGIPFSVENDLTNSNLGDELGIDIATLYYNYSDDRSGIYIINTDTTDKAQRDELINEAISVIRERQITYENETALAADSNSAKSIGIIDVTTTREPKGKLNASYEIFTVQDYSSRDYYIVKANLKGMPGCIMGDNYDSKYQGEGMDATIGSSTSSVTIDAYGPHRTIESNSYSVEIGGAWSTEGNFEISGGWNWTRYIDDTTIEASSTTDTATWNVTLDNNAQETSFDFEPAVTFDCPSNKSTVYIAVNASYCLDSWNTFPETIELSRTIKCTATSASEQ